MNAVESWYVKNEEGKVFGPITFPVLVQWAEESRIESSAKVSTDKTNWKPAYSVAGLKMIWLVGSGDGTFYGPFNRKVVDGLIAARTLPSNSLLYKLDDGADRCAIDKVQVELDAKVRVISELENRAAKQAETTKKTIAFLEAKLAESERADTEKAGNMKQELEAARADVFATRERAEKAERKVELVSAELDKALAEKSAAVNKLSVLETQLADLQSQLEVVTRVSAKKPPQEAKPVVPEIVINEPPPKAAPQMSGGSNTAGLAALEAAARRELSAARKKGMEISGLFGRKK